MTYVLLGKRVETVERLIQNHQTLASDKGFCQCQTFLFSVG